MYITPFPVIRSSISCYDKNWAELKIVQTESRRISLACVLHLSMKRSRTQVTYLRSALFHLLRYNEVT